MPAVRDSSITVPASEYYRAHLFWRLFLGNHYRDSWTAPITVRYFDVKHIKGGLTPLKLGGGFQTKSLTLMGIDGVEYVMRTVDKDPSKTIDTFFRRTFVKVIVQDQISAAHPFGFLVVAKLSSTAGIYHSLPEIFYVPDDSALGKYSAIFKNKLVMLEEYNLTNSSMEPALRGFNSVISTAEINDFLKSSSDNKVDQRLTLRSRVFDMLIGDWDRHEDNWRWAQFNLENGQKIFRPIPRDRDQAFFHFDGLFPAFARLWIPGLRKMQSYKSKPANVKWFNYNARFFDQNYLSELIRNDWREITDSLKNEMTDQVIDSALQVLPDTIYKLTGKELSKTLKGRRDNLSEIADKYYRFRAKKVTIQGTNNADYFEVIRSAPNLTEVNVYQINGGIKGKRSYHRLFTKKETKKILLQGFEGEDVFENSGSAKKKIAIHIVKSKENIKIINGSKFNESGKKFKVVEHTKPTSNIK
ncbi:MAG: hypothetical protein LH473_03625 [Chitinophagales bacterium]|nr:hypothetical protein [Chitinophagales bacterium]